MVDPYLLTELVTFAETGTLAATAQKLHVTQPTVTRGMQKLETLWDVPLFDRQPNRLRLTATGQFAAQEAAKVLAANQALVTTVRNFAATQQTLKVGTTIPGPLIVLAQLAQPMMTVQSQLLPTQSIETTLIQRDQTVILSNQSLTSPLVTSTRIGTERLAVNLNKFMYQANQTTVTFAELANMSFIVLSDIGPWRTIIQQAIPQANFFYQKERAALAEITKYADFPYFSTNLSPLDPAAKSITADDSRVQIPISDPSAQMTVYATYLTTNQTQVQPLIQQLQSAWPTT
ncbi:LysR family transcriptional regulator [Lactiplantibacillus daowaiensis]|uniref:LysR family transcriptional regulator n=1 Tax=Lactiplantibacillus daowaiensis TaxID=2559918 RepID=A0ABW1S269_9LACO|nr:LysR family transcriptional regulator [Lactiplantibacillus daowaiensis]